MIAPVAGPAADAGVGTTAAVRSSADDVVLSHIGAAYRLAIWRLRNKHDAEQVVLESVQQALRHVGADVGGHGRAWFLRIVSDICNDRGLRACISSPAPPDTVPLPHDDETPSLDDAIRSLPEHLREVLVLRDLEGLSYQELAEVVDVPVDTAMSRLSRARQALAGVLFRSPIPV